MDKKFQQSQYLGGSAPLVGAALKQASAWKQMQKTILTSVAQQQNREAQRLQTKYGDQDSSVNDALQRATQLNARLEFGSRQIQSLKRFLSTYAQPGVFHGYVMNSKGYPAHNATVEISVGENSAKTFSANTQADGYFRVLLNASQASKTSNDVKAGTEKSAAQSETDSEASLSGLLKQIAQRQFQLGAGRDGKDVSHNTRDSKDTKNSVASAVVAGSTNSASAVTNLNVRVRVLDASGVERLQDPNPPEFKDGESEFRVYALPLTGGKT